MSTFWISGEKYSIDDWSVDFSNKDLWNELLTSLEEENQVIESYKDLVERGFVVAKQNNETVSKEDHVRKTNSMIKDNQETIEFLTLCLGD